MEIEKLTGIEFHDLPVESIDINNEKNTIDFVVSISRDETYDVKKVTFKSVSEITIDGLLYTADNTGYEINWSETSQHKNGIEIKLIILQGSGLPSLNMNFLFDTVEVTDYI
ncbi:MAG: hypothetical protein H6551_02195 [Chitinophagales bacterium]|nr:hypothetical protein [Chitinophagaceae bacterium]MCB9063935.1 hypothetical protein [Chitinophagales bacterium]